MKTFYDFIPFYKNCTVPIPQLSPKGLAFSSERGGSQIYWGGHKFWERNIGGSIFDDQNVGSHRMTTDSVFILFKKTDSNTILACLGGKVYRWKGVIIFLLPKCGGVAVLSTPTFWKFRTPLQKKMPAPLSSGITGGGVKGQSAPRDFWPGNFRLKGVKIEKL